MTMNHLPAQTLAKEPTTLISQDLNSVPLNQITFREKELPARYAWITGYRLDLPIIAVRDTKDRSRYLAITAPTPLHITDVPLKVFPTEPQERLCLLTFFKSFWKKGHKPPFRLQTIVIKHLTDNGWEIDEIVRASGLSETIVTEHLKLGQHLNPEVLNNPSASSKFLRSIVYFPQSLQVKVLAVVSSQCIGEKLRFLLLKEIMNKVGIVVKVGLGGVTVPKTLTLPTPEEVAGMVEELKARNPQHS